VRFKLKWDHTYGEWRLVRLEITSWVNTGYTSGWKWPLRLKARMIAASQLRASRNECDSEEFEV